MRSRLRCMRSRNTPAGWKALTGAGASHAFIAEPPRRRRAPVRAWPQSCRPREGAGGLLGSPPCARAPGQAQRMKGIALQLLHFPVGDAGPEQLDEPALGGAEESVADGHLGKGRLLRPAPRRGRPGRGGRRQGPGGGFRRTSCGYRRASSRVQSWCRRGTARNVRRR